jgi:hypothetical protein
MNEKEAKLEGFYESCEIFLYAMKRLKDSLNDYAAIEYQEFLPERDKDRVTFAHNTLTVFEQMFMDVYDERIDRIKSQIENDADTEVVPVAL